MAGPVKFFRSTDSGAPHVLNNAAGSLIQVLDACLINGYGSITLDTVVVANGIATATKSTGHNFPNYSTGIGPVISIGGATPSGLNGEVRINAINGTQFTFATTAPDGAATGTITAKRAPGGWEKAFQGTNKAVYRQGGEFSNRFYLRVDDPLQSTARVRGFEYLEDVDGLNGTGLFPTDAQASGGLHAPKSTSTTVKHWVLACDSSSFVMVVRDTGAADYHVGWSFCDLVGLANSADKFSANLIAHDGWRSAGGSAYESLATPPSYMARAMAQTGGSISFTKYCRPSQAVIAGSSDSFPPPGDGLLAFWPLLAFDSSARYRGRIPMVYGAYSIPADDSYIPGAAGGAGDGRVFWFTNGNTGSSSGFYIDIVGPWE